MTGCWPSNTDVVGSAASAVHHVTDQSTCFIYFTSCKKVNTIIGFVVVHGNCMLWCVPIPGGLHHFSDAGIRAQCCPHKWRPPSCKLFFYLWASLISSNIGNCLGAFWFMYFVKVSCCLTTASIGGSVSNTRKNALVHVTKSKYSDCSKSFMRII